ncbi:MAG TPA: hypothetical protein PKA37_11340, partial [Planctomycetota bacterium]|nr:hypothetical protein [Planctomycetota bacterium]
MLRLVLILVLVAAAVLLVFWNPVATGEDQRDAAPEAREELGAVSSTDTAPSKVVAESEPIEAPQPNLEVGPLSIMVFVTDDTGAPLSDARVLFLPELANPLGGPTDTSGFCMLRVPTAERGTVRAEFMGRAEEVADVFPSNVEPIVVHVQFQKAVTVEVRVEDTAGAPI